jgi:hypothetical protein
MNFKSTLAFAAIAFLGFAAAANAQNTSSANTPEGATIAQPLVLSNCAGLFFGGIITGSQAGLVTITGITNGTGTFNETYAGTPGPVKYLGTHSGITAPSIAEFSVTGEPNMSYTISYPANSYVYLNGNTSSTSMQVTDFNPVASTCCSIAPSGHLSGLSSQTSGSSCSSNGGDAWVIGGSLHVGANQVSGTYTGSFTVVITYN